MNRPKKKPFDVKVVQGDGPPLDLDEWANRYVDAVLDVEGFPKDVGAENLLPPTKDVPR